MDANIIQEMTNIKFAIHLFRLYNLQWQEGAVMMSQKHLERKDQCLFRTTNAEFA